ncbi:MAG: hypothetical protein IT326_03245, partial [Anaerolineae bacterium]|nr:hypothetical protein [Anaerolineae bacterium]
MSSPAIKVLIDERIRLLTAVLAATRWPEDEQQQKPHGVHAQARLVRNTLLQAGAAEHPATVIMQTLLDGGHTLDELFSYAVCLDWPGLRARGAALPAWAPKEWSANLRDFMHTFHLKDLWERDRAPWDAAVEQAGRAIATGDPVAFLAQFFGESKAEWVFQPNLLYPTAETAAFFWANRLFCVCPPRIAWGTNPPWPYDDDPASTISDALIAYSRALLRRYLADYPAEVAEAEQSELPVPTSFRERHSDWFDQ